MTQQEAFKTIKKVVDLSLQNGVIKTIEDSKIVFDSLETLYKGIIQQEKRTQKVKQKENEELVIDKKIDTSTNK